MDAQRLRRICREILAMAVVIAGVLAARSTLADHYYVPTGSMEPTLFAGDRVAVDKRAHGVRFPFTTFRITQGERVERGEIVIFDSPRDGKRLIKRIVAVGGDEVLIRRGRLYVNGNPLAEDSAGLVETYGERSVQLNLDDGGGPDYAGSIPQGKLLAVGDHRGNSLDGRVFGLIDEQEVYGRALAVYYRKGDGFVWQPL